MPKGGQGESRQKKRGKITEENPIKRKSRRKKKRDQYF